MKICHWNFEMQCNVYCIILMTITILKARLYLCRGNLDYLDQSNSPIDGDKAESQHRIVDMSEFETPLQPLLLLLYHLFLFTFIKLLQGPLLDLLMPGYLQVNFRLLRGWHHLYDVGLVTTIKLDRLAVVVDLSVVVAAQAVHVRVHQHLDEGQEQVEDQPDVHHLDVGRLG